MDKHRDNSAQPDETQRWWPTVPLLAHVAEESESEDFKLEDAAIEAAKSRLGDENVQVERGVLFLYCSRNMAQGLLMAFNLGRQLLRAKPQERDLTDTPPELLN